MAKISTNIRPYVDSVFNRILLFALLVSYWFCSIGSAFAQDLKPLFPKQDMTNRVKLADGLRLLKLAGNDQIPNAYCIAAHPSGDLIVSGPGYLRRLKFSKDGLAKVTNLPHPPAGGAQGLWCEGDDLLFVGGEGLCRLKGALRALSETQLANLAMPEVLLKIENGQEHQAHAIRRAADGWWYLICGNQTKLEPKFSSDKDSPVKEPEAGCLLRFNLEQNQYQVFAHGFRNAYDFDFGPDGSVYVYDSDGERDVSLPWYRPTRVFRVAAGDHAGWVNKSWKRPSYYPDMPTEVAALGRGSPTGVCYNGGQRMGEQFATSLFVGDWTFGRIVAIDVAKDDQKPVDLLLSKGQFGFAVTDMVIGADGLLYVSVGGRGTEGGLFRVEPNRSTSDDLSGMALATGNKSPQLKRKERKDSPSQTMDLVRKWQLEFGGCGGCEGMMAGYTAKKPWPKSSLLSKKLGPICDDLVEKLRRKPTADKELDEVLRLCAMQRVQSNRLGGTILKVLEREYDPVRAIHLLNCYSCIGKSASAEQAQQISQFLFGLKGRIAKDGLNTDRNWEPRMKELVTALAKDAKIRKAIVDSPSLGEVDTLYIFEALMNAPAGDVDDNLKSKVARGMLDWCLENPKETTARHVQLFGKDPNASLFLRFAVRDSPHLLSSTVSVLLKKPVEADRAIFVRGLSSARLQTKKQSAIGLRRLLERGADALSFEETQVALTVLSRLGSDGPATSVKKQMMLMLKSSFGKEPGYPDADMAQTRQFLETRFVRPFILEAEGTIDVDQWMAKVTWDQGDVDRGRATFTKVQCAVCHQAETGQTGSAALGPALEGITKRFSKRAIFQAILEPSRDVADRYRAVLVETEDGDFVTGLKVYQSADGITLLLADGSTARINTDQIAELKQSNQSLMPARLLDNLTPKENADLWAFLKTL